MSRTTAVQIANAAAGAAGSKEHKRFQQLLERIEKARQRLSDWQQQLPLFAQAHAVQIKPRKAHLATLNRGWALELEQVLLGRKWSQAERDTLQQWITRLVIRLLDDTDSPDNELAALYQRMTGMTPEEEEARHTAEVKAMLEEASGLDLGEDTPGSLDELLERAQQGMREQQQARADGQDGAPDEPHMEGQRPASARRRKRTAAQQKADAEAARVTQTCKEVYRKLAAALHPDRAAATATDEERALRGDRMAQANAAYEAGDLLALLTLQLQIEQIDLSRAAQLPDEQVRHFNRVLQQQLKELEADILERERAFCMGYGYGASKRIDPNKLADWIKEETRELLAEEATLKHDQRMLRADPSGTKRLLKELAHQMREQERVRELLFRGGWG